MFPAKCAQAVFMTYFESKLRCTIRKNLPARGEVVTKCTVKIEEDGFYAIW